jgi:hypothetical protein
MMKLAYRLSYEAGRCVAECLEADVEGEGRTEAEAVESLRLALEDLFRPDAVAPPSRVPEHRFDLVRVL